MREFSTPPVATVDDADTLTDQVWDNATKSPDAAQFARRTPGGWDPVTCAEFRDEVADLARRLMAAGVPAGARVGLLCRTRYEWTLVDYALLACGAVVVPIYDSAGPEQVEWTLSDSGAMACVVESTAHADLVRGVAERLPGAFQVWSIDAGDLTRLEPTGVAPEDVEARRGAVRADDVATIVYTSGTTGNPKGCTLTHRNLLTDVVNTVPSLPDVFARPDASTLLFLPLAHAFARLVQFGCVRAQVTMAHLPDPRELVDELGSFRPTFLLAIPRVFEKIHDGARQQAGGGLRGALFDRGEQVAVRYSRALDGGGAPGLAVRLRHAVFDQLIYRRLRSRLGGRCTVAVSGGAPLSPRLAHFFRGAGVAVYEGYGLTETSPAVAANVAGATRVGTVGRPLPGVTVRIADDGEVLIGGQVVFAGYWRDPPATAEMVDQHGWLHTGDLGELDRDGYLSITGRKKEMIVTAGGKNVSPATLEERLRSHPLISQGMVVGDRKPFVAALVTLDEEALSRWLADRGRAGTESVAQLRDDPDLVAEVQSAVDLANRAGSRSESIRQFRILPRDLSQDRGELTPTMKVRRSVVQREYADEIDEIYRR